VRYRTRGQERRDHRFELKLPDGERDVLAAAANRSGLTLAAWLVRAGLDVAEHRMAPTRAEQEKAARAGRAEPPRATLQRQVAAAAAGTRSEAEFFASAACGSGCGAARTTRAR
jgi:hypothetical protein